MAFSEHLYWRFYLKATRKPSYLTCYVFLFSLSHMTPANPGRINPDCRTGRGNEAELTAETPFLPLAVRAVLIGSTAHDSTFGEAFLSQCRWKKKKKAEEGGGGEKKKKDNPNSSLTSCAEHILLKPAGAAPFSSSGSAGRMVKCTGM